jgi:GMP synthase (glutamine-hydrolysing)
LAERTAEAGARPAAGAIDLEGEAQTSARARPGSATEEVVVLDYGGQYSQLIARRVRECGVFSELLPHHVGVAEVMGRHPKGIILSGGPASVYEQGAPRLRR